MARSDTPFAGRTPSGPGRAEVTSVLAGLAVTALPDGSGDVCVEYTGCSTTTRYCLYEASAGHQAPTWFAASAMAWFLSF